MSKIARFLIKKMDAFVDVTRVTISFWRKAMKTQEDVVGKWKRSNQLAFFGKTFWGDK